MTEKMVKDEQLNYLIDLLKSKYIENVSVSSDGFISITKNGITSKFELSRVDHTHTAEEIGADPLGSANQALNDAKSYTDNQISTLFNDLPETKDTLYEINAAIEDNKEVIELLNKAIGNKANKDDLKLHVENLENPHNVTKSQLGLSNVENKSSETIRSEITKENVTDALGYTPPTQDTTYNVVTKSKDGLVPSLTENSNEFLRADGQWAIPPNSEYTHPSYVTHSGGPVNDLSPNFGESFTIPQVISDNTGHVTNVNNRTINIPNTTVSDTKNGLMLSEDKIKLDNIEEGAEVNQNAFTTIKFNTIDIVANEKTDTLNILSGNNITFSSNDDSEYITISAKDTTYELADSTKDGLLSKDDKAKLDTIEDGANKNQNAFSVISVIGDNTRKITAADPTSTLTINAGSNITLGGESGQIEISAKDTTYDLADSTKDGLLSKDDKVKLDTIEEGATKTIIDSSLSDTSENPVQNKVIKSELDNINTKIDDISKSLANPVDGGNADTLDGKHADDFVYIDEVVDLPQANKLLRLNSNAKLPADITGDADTLDGKHASDFVFNEDFNELKSKVGTDNVSTQIQNALNNYSANKNDLKLHVENLENPHQVTKSQIGLGNVENKSSETIRSEITKDNVTDALGYTPPTENTTYTVVSDITDGLMLSEDKIKLDTIDEGANKTIVDSLLSDTSENPVQNKVINSALNEKVPTTRTINNKSLESNITLDASDIGVDPKGTANTIVSDHNTNTNAHNDIRNLITNLTKRLDALVDSDDEALDQLSEIVTYIKNNKSLIEGITTNKINVSDIINDLITNDNKKPLSAAQGVELKRLITLLETEVNNKALASDLTDHKDDIDIHITPTERTGWNAAKNHANSTHAPIDAEKNQNAFSNVRVGNIIIASDTTTDTLEISGDNVTITPDMDNDKITIGITKDNVANALGYYPPVKDTTYNIASNTTDGLLSKDDKTKLDTIDEGANKTIVDSSLSETSTNPVQNKVIYEALNEKVSTSRTINNKSLESNITLTASDVNADPSGTATNVISDHNVNDTAHNDIRLLITNLTKRLDTLADSDDETLDQLSEIITYIKSNESLIKGVTTSKVNVDDIIDNLVTNDGKKVLSASQGVELKRLIDNLVLEVNNKALTSDLTDHTSNNSHITGEERTNWNAAKNHADSAHAPTDAEKNQNAFSSIKVSNTFIIADNTSDTLELLGDNVTITPDIANDKVTISITKDNVTDALGYTPSDKDTTYNVVSDTKDGLMLSSDKVKLDTIDEGANKTIVDSLLSDTSENPVQNKIIKSELDNKVPTSRTINNKSLETDIILTSSDVNADPSGTANTAVSNHNVNTSSHEDIRLLINNLTQRLNVLADSDDITLDQLSEIVAYIKSNKSLIEGITTNKVNVNDIVDNLITNVTNQPLSAAQGVELKRLIDELQREVNAKAINTDLTTHTNNNNIHITSEERENWNVAKTHANSDHAPINAEPNQNAFSVVSVNGTNITANTTTDTLSLSGNNVTITTNNSMDGINISITKNNVTDALGYTPPSENTTYTLANSVTDGLLSKDDKVKLDSVEKDANKTIIDEALSNNSTNPVQNKVIKSELDSINTKINNIPSSFPADGGNSDTVDGKHADDFVSINDVVTSSQANKILKLNNNGKLPADITGDADTLDGKHASDFASSTDFDELKSKVGTNSVSEQINTTFNNTIIGLSAEGNIITYTKGDNSTDTITIEDEETIYTQNDEPLDVPDGTLWIDMDAPLEDPGTIPIRGIDYWTEEDIAEIKRYVDEAILGGVW